MQELSQLQELIYMGGIRKKGQKGIWGCTHAHMHAARTHFNALQQLSLYSVCLAFDHSSTLAVTKALWDATLPAWLRAFRDITLSPTCSQEAQGQVAESGGKPLLRSEGGAFQRMQMITWYFSLPIIKLLLFFFFLVPALLFYLGKPSAVKLSP